VREGRYGRLRPNIASPDEAADPQAGHPEAQGLHRRPEQWSDVFREATWEEALDLAASGLRDARDTYGKRGACRFRLGERDERRGVPLSEARTHRLRSNNVDHCTRLCHASSVAALMEGINSGAVSNQVRDVRERRSAVRHRANPTMNHPVAATWMKNAVEARRDADHRRPAPQRPWRVMPPITFSSTPIRRRAPQRPPPRHRRGRPRRR